MQMNAKKEKYPTFKNRTITDEQAAALYLEDWTIDEFGDDWDGEDKPGRKKEINDELIKAGYPGTEDLIYDNEACPMIYWTDPNFDHDAWVAKHNEELGSD